MFLIDGMIYFQSRIIFQNGLIWGLSLEPKKLLEKRDTLMESICMMNWCENGWKQREFTQVCGGWSRVLCHSHPRSPSIFLLNFCRISAFRIELWLDSQLLIGLWFNEFQYQYGSLEIWEEAFGWKGNVDWSQNSSMEERYPLIQVDTLVEIQTYFFKF